MTDDEKPGLWENVKGRVAAHADALKASTAAALREKAAEIREAIGPEKIEPVTQPERPFGRDEGGEDIKRVVWTGHTVETSEGQRYFGAVGLTESGYYRAAEVQSYGAEESWRWQAERHTDKRDAIGSAESMSANRLSPESGPATASQEESRANAAREPSIQDRLDEPRTPQERDQMVAALYRELDNPDGGGARLRDMADGREEQNRMAREVLAGERDILSSSPRTETMAEIPDHVKAQADAEMKKTGGVETVAANTKAVNQKEAGSFEALGHDVQVQTPKPDPSPDKG